MDSISIALSVGALIISLVSLYVSARTAHRTWEGQSRLPYYKELSQSIEAIDELFTHEVGIFRLPNLENVRHTASSLGLDDIASDLREIEELMKIMDEERHDQPRNIPEERRHIASVKARTASIGGFVRRDTERLTKTHIR